MPRKPLELPQNIEYMSILDENGEIDQGLEPKLSDATLKTMYRFMLLARRLDERMLNLQRQGRIGTFPQSSGHEAVSIGSILAVEQSDWHVPAYRELAGMLYRGWPIATILLYWGGFEEGNRPPDGVHDLPYCVPIASQLLHAAGIGMAMNIKHDKSVVLTYFGDGASSEGDCHEALNFASVFAAPVVFLCQNNQWAISVPLTRQMKCKTIAQKAVAYGMPGIQVDGNDVLAVYRATSEAVERARLGLGPTLIEGVTYRVTPHTTADDPKRYRSDEEVQQWLSRDCLIRFAVYLEKKGILSEGQRKDLEEEIELTIKQAVKQFEEMARSKELTDPLAMFDYLFEKMPPYLQHQKEELREYLHKLTKGNHQTKEKALFSRRKS